MATVEVDREMMAATSAEYPCASVASGSEPLERRRRIVSSAACSAASIRAVLP